MNKSVVIGTAGGIVSALIASNAITTLSEAEAAIEKIAAALVKAAQAVPEDPKA